MKERNQEKPSPTKGSKGKEQKTHEDSQDAMLPKKANKEADKTTPQSEEAPPNVSTSAEPATPTNKISRKVDAEAPPV